MIPFLRFWAMMAPPLPTPSLFHGLTKHVTQRTRRSVQRNCKKSMGRRRRRNRIQLTSADSRIPACRACGGSGVTRRGLRWWRSYGRGFWLRTMGPALTMAVRRRRPHGAGVSAAAPPTWGGFSAEAIFAGRGPPPSSRPCRVQPPCRVTPATSGRESTFHITRPTLRRLGGGL